MIKPYTFISLSLRLSLPLPSKLGSTIPRLCGRPLGILFLQVIVIIRIAPQCKKTGRKPWIEQNKDRRIFVTLSLPHLPQNVSRDRD